MRRSTRIPTWVMDNHAIAIEAPAKELVRGTPEVQAKATIVELAEPLDDEFAVGIEVTCPLPKGKEIAVAIVEDLEDADRGTGKPVKKIVENQEGVVPRVNILHHEGRQLVLLGACTAVKEDAAP